MSTIESNTRNAYTCILSAFNIPASLTDPTPVRKQREVKARKGNGRQDKREGGGGPPGRGRVSPAKLVSEVVTDGAPNIT